MAPPVVEEVSCLSGSVAATGLGLALGVVWSAMVSNQLGGPKADPTDSSSSEDKTACAAGLGKSVL